MITPPYVGIEPREHFLNVAKANTQHCSVVLLIYTPYYYVDSDRYIRITLLEYYYIYILAFILIVVLNIMFLGGVQRYGH